MVSTTMLPSDERYRCSRYSIVVTLPRPLIVLEMDVISQLLGRRTETGATPSPSAAA